VPNRRIKERIATVNNRHLFISNRLVPRIEAVNLSLDIEGEKSDGFGPVLSVAVSGPGEILLQNPGDYSFHIALRG